LPPCADSVVIYCNDRHNFISSDDRLLDLQEDFSQGTPIGFHHPDNTSFFDADFALFDDCDVREIEKSLLNDPSLPSSSTSPSSPVSPAFAPLLGFALFDLGSDLLTDDLPTTSSSSPSTSFTTPSQQVPTPSASGSEEHSSDHELTPPPSESGFHGFPDSVQKPIPATSPQPTLHPPIFPPLDALPSASISALSTPTSLPASADINHRKRKSCAASLRPKELVATEILSDDDDQNVKRKRNTAAARRYRQKKQDMMKELEEALDSERKEKEHWKTEAQRQRMEAEKWFTMVQFMQKSMGK